MLRRHTYVAFRHHPAHSAHPVDSGSSSKPAFRRREHGFEARWRASNTVWKKGTPFVIMRVMKLGAAILCSMALGAVLVGCASQPPGPRARSAELPESPRYEESTASALVFDPPVAYGEPPLELSREDRLPSAFVAYEEPTVTYFWIHTDDWQGSDWGTGGCGGRFGGIGGLGDCYQRRAVMDKVGISYR
jgi:hypothetical protein